MTPLSSSPNPEEDIIYLQIYSINSKKSKANKQTKEKLEPLTSLSYYC